MSDLFKQEKFGFSNQRYPAERSRLSKNEEISPFERTSSLNSAGSGSDVGASNGIQELNAGYGMYNNRGFNFQNDMNNEHQLEASRTMRDFDVRQSTSVLGRDINYSGEKGESRIQNQVKDISRRQKEQRENQKQTQKHFSFYGGYTGGKSDKLETEKQRVFSGHYTREQIPNFIKLGEISDDMKNTLSKLPSKKKLSSRHKQSSFKETLESYELLKLDLEQHEEAKRDRIADNDNYFYGDPQQKENGQELTQASNAFSFKGLIPEQDTSLKNQLNEVQNKETKKKSLSKVKILEFNNTPVKQRRPRVYSANDNPPFSSNNIMLGQQQEHLVGLRHHKLQQQQQSKHEQILSQHELQDFNHFYTDQEQTSYLVQSDLLLQGGVFPNQSCAPINSKSKTMEYLPLIKEERQHKHKDASSSSNLFQQFGKDKDTGLFVGSLMQGQTSKVIEEDYHNEDSKLPSPNNELLNLQSQEIVISQFIQQNDMFQSTELENIEKQIAEERKERGYEEDIDQSVQKLYEQEEQEEYIFREDGDPNDLLKSYYEQGLMNRIEYAQRSIQRTKYLNIMVAGPAGIGKTSFVQLFLKKFQFKKTRDLLNTKSKKQIKQNKSIEPTKEPKSEYAFEDTTKVTEEYQITKKINGHQIVLKMIDTAGYGNCENIKSWKKNITNYLKSNLIKYENERKKIEDEEKDNLKRINKVNNIKDQRVHLLLYFFGSHHSTTTDFQLLKRIQKYVNVIPIIPKADSFKPQELLTLKLEIINAAIDRKIRFFDCVEAIRAVVGDNEEMNHKITSKLLNWQTPKYQEQQTKLIPKTHECPPFAVISPDDYHTFIDEKGQKCIQYGRKYPWGFCDAFSDEYSDFGRLYKLIINILWTQLVEVTDKAIMSDYFKKLDKRHLRNAEKLKSTQKLQMLAGFSGVGIVTIALTFMAKKIQQSQNQ